MSYAKYYNDAVDTFLRDGTIILTTIIGTLLSYFLCCYGLEGQFSSVEYFLTVFLIFICLSLINSIVMIIVINKTKNAFLKVYYLSNSRSTIKKYILPIFILNLIFIIIAMFTNQPILVGLFTIYTIMDVINTISSTIPSLMFVFWILVIPVFLFFIFTCISIIVNQNSIMLAVKEGIKLMQEIKIKMFVIIMLPMALNYLLLCTLGPIGILTTYISFVFTIILATMVYMDMRKNEKTIKDKVLNISKYPKTTKSHNKPIPIQKTTNITPSEEIGIYKYNIKNHYISIKKISAFPDVSIDSEKAKLDDINNKLKEKASKLGANALIQTKYKYNILKRSQGMQGTGKAVYIENIENIKKSTIFANMFLILAVFWIILGIFGFITQFLLFGLFFMLWGIMMRVGYLNKTLLLGFSGFIVLLGIKLFYLIYQNGIQITNPWFFVNILLFVMALTALIGPGRGKDPNIDWKNKWGF